MEGETCTVWAIMERVRLQPLSLEGVLQGIRHPLVLIVMLASRKLISLGGVKVLVHRPAHFQRRHQPATKLVVHHRALRLIGVVPSCTNMRLSNSFLVFSFPTDMLWPVCQQPVYKVYYIPAVIGFSPFGLDKT